MTADLRLGRWQDVLADAGEVQTIYSDPPFSARTHDGYRSGLDVNRNNQIGYTCLQPQNVHEFVSFWKKKVAGWIVLHCDHITHRWWEEAWSEAGFYTFAPVPWIKQDAGPRMAGDGPACGVEYLFIARTRSWPKVRKSRPAWYDVQVCKLSAPDRIVGQKRVVDVRQVLLDYSSAGDLVVDPYAGMASIGIACIELGRSYLGSEVNPTTYAWAKQQINGALVADRQIALIPDERRMKQQGLFNG